MLLSIAQSDRKCESVWYEIYKAFGMTPTTRRWVYGFENMKSRGTKVEQAISEIQKIQEAIFDLATIEDEALLVRFGILVAMDSSSDVSDEEEMLSLEDLDRLTQTSSPNTLEYCSVVSTQKPLQDLPGDCSGFCGGEPSAGTMQIQMVPHT